MKFLFCLVALQLVSSFTFASHKGSSLGLGKTHGSLSKSRSHLPLLRMSSEEGSAAITASAVPKIKGGDSTMASSVFNLAKAIVGCGVLSLPSGIAFFSDAPTAVLPASIVCAAMGIISAYSFSVLGSACEQHGVSTFQDCWAKSVDEKSAWLISASITTMCFLASLAYSIIIADSFTSLAQSFNLPAVLSSRSNIIILLTASVLYPLCSLRSLAALSPFSLMGLGGTLYAALFMAIRFFDGSYKKGGKFFETLAATSRPVFGTKGPWTFNNNMWVLVSMLSTSYMAHYSAPKFYSELKNTSMPRFNKVIGYSFSVSVVAFIIMMSLGYLTFGGATAGFVLNNYANNDVLATVARLAIGSALLTGYPFTFTAMRDGILDIAKATPEKRAAVTKPLNIGLVITVTILAILLKDVGFVVSLSGALFGSTLMFMVPSWIRIQNLKKLSNGVLDKSKKMEVVLNYFVMVMGAGMGALGVLISIMKQLGKL